VGGEGNSEATAGVVLKAHPDLPEGKATIGAALAKKHSLLQIKKLSI
jgi:hypothetical protein